ncbi:unnamed protein product [Boreogadus saida]
MEAEHFIENSRSLLYFSIEQRTYANQLIFKGVVRESDFAHGDETEIDPEHSSSALATIVAHMWIEYAIGSRASRYLEIGERCL